MLSSEFLVQQSMRRIKPTLPFDHGQGRAQLVTYIRQEAPLDVEQVFQPAEGVVEGVDELPDLVLRRAMVWDAPGEIVGMGDLQGYLGHARPAAPAPAGC